MQNLGFKASLSSLAISALALSGCVYGETRHVVRTQFAAETECTEVRVEDRKPFEAGYKEGQLTVRGCGVTRVYTCPADAGFISYDDDELCSFETSVAAQPPTAAMPPSSGMDDDMGGDMGGDTMDEPAAEPMDEPAAEPAMDEPSQQTGGDAAEPAAEPEAKPSPFSGKASTKGGKAKASGKFKLGKKK